MVSFITFFFALALRLGHTKAATSSSSSPITSILPSIPRVAEDRQLNFLDSFSLALHESLPPFLLIAASRSRPSLPFLAEATPVRTRPLSPAGRRSAGTPPSQLSGPSPFITYFRWAFPSCLQLCLIWLVLAHRLLCPLSSLDLYPVVHCTERVGNQLVLRAHPLPSPVSPSIVACRHITASFLAIHASPSSGLFTDVFLLFLGLRTRNPALPRLQLRPQALSLRV